MAGRTHMWPLIAAASACVAAPAASAASPASPRAQAGVGTAALEQESNAALLGVFALDARLDRAEANVAALRARGRALARAQARGRARIASLRRALSLSRLRLARRVRTVYEEQEREPLAVLLGATTLHGALRRFDDLEREANAERALVARVREQQAALAALARSQLAREAELEALARALAREQASLTGARRERSRRAARLVAARRAESEAASARTERLAAIRARNAAKSAGAITGFPFAPEPPTRAAPSPASFPWLRAPLPGRLLTVTATAYAFPGRTATGIPVGMGVVAVDPAVIPLGSRLAVPGYGLGIAADTGSAIRGAAIDLWFPTTAQALAWGRRTVTIGVY